KLAKTFFLAFVEIAQSKRKTILVPILCAQCPSDFLEFFAQTVGRISPRGKDSAKFADVVVFLGIFGINVPIIVKIARGWHQKLVDFGIGTDGVVSIQNKIKSHPRFKIGGYKTFLPGIVVFYFRA